MTILNYILDYFLYFYVLVFSSLKCNNYKYKNEN